MAISVQDPRLLVQSLIRLGPSSDGAVERDLLSVIDRIMEENRTLAAKVEILEAEIKVMNKLPHLISAIMGSNQ